MDGVPDAVSTWEFDAHHNVLRNANDFNGDGTFEYITEYVYDENHALEEKREDWDGDGTLEVVNRYENAAECWESVLEI